MNNFQISLNTLERTIEYKNVEKNITDSFWIDEIEPLLYPLWSTDKDKLEYFIKKQDGIYIIFKNKYTRNHKTKTYQWVTYEEDISEYTTEELDGLYEALKNKFLEFKSIEHKDINESLKREYFRNNVLDWGKVRMIRNFLLNDSDWTQLVDSSISREEKKQWKLYRTKLRDITNLYSNTDPSNVKWPITPKKYKSLDDKKYAYLEDGFGHFYTFNNIQIEDLSEKIIKYLDAYVFIDEDKIKLLDRPPEKQVQSLDSSLEYTLDDLIDFVTKPKNAEPTVTTSPEPDLDNLIDYVMEEGGLTKA